MAWLKTQQVIHDVDEKGKLYYLLNAFNGAVNNLADAISRGGSTGNNSQVLTAINNLDRKVDTFMATQEERLRGIKVKLDAVQVGVDKIQEQLAALKASNPELEDEIAAIEETASAIDTDVNPPTPEPTPEA